MNTVLDDLYRSDYYAWTRQQADELRRLRVARLNTPLDLANLAEEIESLGRSDLRRVKSQLRRIMEHLLKLRSIAKYYWKIGSSRTMHRNAGAGTAWP